MAEPHDPTARLRPLWEAQARRRRAVPAPVEEAVVVEPRAVVRGAGWTPIFETDELPDDEPADDAGVQDGAARPDRVGRGAGLTHIWSRWRDRWVPSADAVRWDPGRRGGALIAAVGVVALLVAALGWLPGNRGETVGPSSVAVAAGTAVPLDTSTGGEPDPGGATTDGVASPTTATSVPVSAVPVDIVVAVTGGVVRPGVVTLPAGARVADAIAAAGGVRDGTDFTGLNLAARLVDGDSVVVGGTSQGVRGDAPAAAGGGATTGGAAAPLDLNAADATALEALPGVGPVMAANILAWREDHGGFTSVEQLQEISGIGPARYATLSALVRVG